jgi:hypothetical protein
MWDRKGALHWQWPNSRNSRVYFPLFSWWTPLLTSNCHEASDAESVASGLNRDGQRLPVASATSEPGACACRVLCRVFFSNHGLNERSPQAECIHLQFRSILAVLSLHATSSTRPRVPGRRYALSRARIISSTSVGCFVVVSPTSSSCLELDYPTMLRLLVRSAVCTD